MFRQKKIIAETLYDIKLRYEDTSYVLFREQQKRSANSYVSFGNSSQSYVHSSYGNPAVTVQKRGNDVTKADEKPVESRVCSVIGIRHRLDMDITNTKQNNWYAFSGTGKVPAARVGHTLSFFPDIGSGIVLCVGGATPSGPFEDTSILDLATWHWEILPTGGFKPRYEHIAFVPTCSDQKIHVFGGADLSGNMTSMQTLDVTTRVWKDVPDDSGPMKPRTHHTCAVVSGNLLVMFSGGHSGADPVDDQDVHVYDARTGEWSTPEIQGTSPDSRQGHVMGALGTKVYLHGGMKGECFFDDLHVLDTDTYTWTDVSESSKNKPVARAAHGGIAYGERFFIFGGMTESGPLNDMHALDSESLIWTEILFGTPPPSPRLDFAMCLIEFRRPCEDIVPEDEDETTVENEDDVCGAAGLVSKQRKYDFILIHGGMNTNGDILDDCFLLRL